MFRPPCNRNSVTPLTHGRPRPLLPLVGVLACPRKAITLTSLEMIMGDGARVVVASHLGKTRPPQLVGLKITWAWLRECKSGNRAQALRNRVRGLSCVRARP